MALRPSWDCASCGQSWPCAVAKTELAERYRSAELGLFLASCLAEVIDQLRDDGRPVPPGLYARFLGWIRTDGRRGASGRP